MKYNIKIISLFNKKYIKRVQYIFNQIYNISNEQQHNDMSNCKNIRTNSTSSVKLPFHKECELREYLANNINIISSAIKTDVKLYGTEIDVNGYKCDLVVKNHHTLYPIELKIQQANHAVVSQIAKYCFYFYRKLRYDRYLDVQGVVCANSFDEWSINELRRQGHLIFDIIPKNNDVFLRAI